MQSNLLKANSCLIQGYKVSVVNGLPQGSSNYEILAILESGRYLKCMIMGMQNLMHHSMHSSITILVEEVELGGLEDEEDDLTPIGLEDEEFLLDKEERASPTSNGLQ
ncbi:Uncharacterized protein Fot_55150 [Forsythia ovata]|uniref:Uncharacterized protein n=1 Tax=Forsythia ovata TaxID=205694 RepID=A0ABD1P5H8_9LAMI